MKKGRLIVISGFSGAGKGTVVKEVVRKYGYSLSVSATTRAPREGEVDGKDYHFKTVEEFKNLIDYNGFVEWTQYVDNYYGTPRKYLEEEIAAGKDVILEIEVKGAMNIRSQYPDSVLMFITTQNVDVLRERLGKRGTEDDEIINKRIKRACEESKFMGEYDFVVVNDDIDECVDTVHSIIISQKCRKEENEELIESIQKDFEEKA